MKLAHLDYRNDPDAHQQGMLNIRSARAICEGHRADVAWIQPFIFKWNGDWVTNFQWDAEMLHISRGNQYLPVPISGTDISEAYVLDFSTPRVVDEFIGLITTRIGREHITPFFDYATWDYSWEPSLTNITDDEWMRWGFGWARVKENFTSAWVQTNRPITQHAVFLEKVGWSLNPLPRVKSILAARKNCIIRFRDVPAAKQTFVEWMIDTYDAYKGLWWDD